MGRKKCGAPIFETQPGHRSPQGRSSKSTQRCLSRKKGAALPVVNQGHLLFAARRTAPIDCFLTRRDTVENRKTYSHCCPSSNHLRPICGLANGVSGPYAVKVMLRFGDASRCIKRRCWMGLRLMRMRSSRMVCLTCPRECIHSDGESFCFDG